MSTQGQIVDFLRNITPEKTGIIPLTPNAMALQTGFGKQTVSKMLSTLKQAGRIELIKSDNGREIVGVKPLDLAPRRPGPKSGVRPPVRTRHATPVEIVPAMSRKVKNTVSTPNVDQYARAKAHFATVQQEWGDHIEATFKINPWAEEGLALRDRLTSMENQLVECRVERDEYKRNFEAVSAKKRERMTAAAQKSGALAAQAEA